MRFRVSFIDVSIFVVNQTRSCAESNCQTLPANGRHRDEKGSRNESMYVDLSKGLYEKLSFC